MATAVGAFHIGPGLDEKTTHGPLIHAKALKKVEEHVEDARSKGAKVLVGGKAAPELGACYYQPTVISGATSNMRIMSEETFGPVAALFPFETEEEVVAMANSAEGIFSRYEFTEIW